MYQTWRSAVVALLLTLGFGGVACAQLAPPEVAALKALDDRITQGADPIADAVNAAKRGEFGMVVSGIFPGEGRTLGVTCMTPYLHPPAVLARFLTSDFLPAPNTPLGQSKLRIEGYGTRYNQTLIDQPGFPYADLCRAQTSAPVILRLEGGLAALETPGRPLKRPVLTLQEAARRGTLADLRKHLRGAELDAMDAFGLTALAWAVARDRPDQVNALLAAGANPATQRGDTFLPPTAILVAVTFGRNQMLDQLLAHHGGAPPPWPETYVEAAIRSDDPAMIRRVFRDPHRAPRPEQYGRHAPSPEVAAVLIEVQGRQAANALLIQGSREANIDLMWLALSHGADPNTIDQQHDTPLGLALLGFKPEHEAAIDLLIAQKADVNLQAAQGRSGVRPVWMALRRYRVLRRRDEAAATHALRSVLAAGADPRTPDVAGLPPIWSILFSPRVDPAEIDSAPSPEVLELLTKAGLDLNAPLNGKRALDVVETQAGASSEIATTLRRLGAVHAASEPVLAKLPVGE